ncbi:MAG: hypothetical protein IKO43_02300 [Kiritimatiellae bacterium]|nr:hypothetical protein [Kiritimatiellia bacterium]
MHGRFEMARKAFTLVELLVIIAIMGAMATVSVLSIRSGQGAARMKGASRDIFATVRQARSVALVTQQPAIITYSETEVDGEKCARVEINSAKLVSTKGVVKAETLAGDVVYVGGDGESAEETTKVEFGEDGASVTTTKGGESIEEVLFAPMADEIVKGVRIKVTIGDELLEVQERETTRAAKVSVFSNVDYLLGKFSEAEERKAADAKAKEAEDAGAQDSGGAASAYDLQEKVSVVWEVNGRCEPHRIWVYEDGSDPDKGLCISVDRFGAAKIVSSEDERR